MSDLDKTPAKGSKSTSVKKKAATKKVVTKKSVAKKSTTKKSGQRKPVVKSSSTQDIQGVVNDINQNREKRDQQITALLQEVREGFSVFANKIQTQEVEHKTEMAKLYQSLQGVFSNLNDDSSKKEKLNLGLLQSLSDSMVKEHEQTLKEIQEQGRLQDKKLKNRTQLLEQRTGKNRLLAIPGVMLAVLGIVYMFYVVNVMESAMTSMSQDMHKIEQSVQVISTNTGTMSRDLNYLHQDMRILKDNVAPTMNGLRDMMPWTQ